MSVLEAVLVLVAGTAAGMINAVVGSGTLITFPTLLALGLPPVTANVSNNAGLAPGSISAAWGYRRELKGQRARLLRLGSASLLGAVVGSLLLLVLPSGAFDAIVPALIAIGLLLVVFGPRIQRRVVAAAAKRGRERGEGPRWLWPVVAATGVYGGYFGAAQGVLLLAVLGIAVDDDLQRLNGTKNVLAAVVNGVAAVIFIAVAHLDWTVVALIAVGSVVGAQVGATVGRRLPPVVFRALIVVVGVAALVSFVVG